MFLRVTLHLTVSAMLAVGAAHAQTELLPYVNVLGNEGFEIGGAADDSLVIVTPPAWLVAGNATQVSYGASGLFPPSGGEGGLHFLAGGPQSAVSTVAQRFVVTEFGLQYDIDHGWTLFTLGAWLGGASTEADASVVEVQFADAIGATLGTAVLGPVTAADRNNQTRLLHLATIGDVPVGTRHVECKVTMTRIDGTYNNGYCDGLSLIFIVPDPVEVQTWSAVKALYRAER